MSKEKKNTMKDTITSAATILAILHNASGNEAPLEFSISETPANLEHLKGYKIVVTPPEKENNNANCYECKHVGSIPGDAHCRCRHPEISAKNDSGLGDLMSLLGKRMGACGPVSTPGFRIVGDEHGIKKGWFNWPFNYDPVWLENCDKFEKKET